MTTVDVILLELETFSISIQTDFIHINPRAISSGTLSHRYNHYDLIKQIYLDDDYYDGGDGDDDNDGGDDDGTHHFLNSRCQLLFYVPYVFFHLTLATIL